MGCCTTCQFSPCACDQDFTIPNPDTIGNTLVRSLVPCVDKIRDLYTCLGARAYTISLVYTRWTGGVRGRGAEEVIRNDPILPTPEVSDFTSISQDVISIGTEEIGEIRVGQISARYTEDELLGTGTSPDQNFYWEIQFLSPNGATVRRRFVPSSAPNLEPLQFEWTITLTRAQEDRTRVLGEPRG